MDNWSIQQDLGGAGLCTSRCWLTNAVPVLCFSQPVRPGDMDNRSVQRHWGGAGLRAGRSREQVGAVCQAPEWTAASEAAMCGYGGWAVRGGVGGAIYAVKSFLYFFFLLLWQIYPTPELTLNAPSQLDFLSFLSQFLFFITTEGPVLSISESPKHLEPVATWPLLSIKSLKTLYKLDAKFVPQAEAEQMSERCWIKSSNN